MQKFIGGVLLGLFLSACGGEFSYKQGATANDLSRTKKLCQSERLKTEAEVNQCLEKNGWSVHQLDDLDLFAIASVNPNNQNPQNVEEKGVTDKQASSTAMTENEEKNTTSTQKKPSKEINPLEIYTVSSWWKMGASPAKFEANSNECVANLGEAHKPNTQTQQVTRGFVVCMHEKGWKALKAK